METVVFFAVLLAALLHAGWNALVKVGLDRFMTVSLISLSSGVLSVCALPFVDIPIAAAWPWLITSTFLHTGYKLFLIQAYKSGDLGQVYPIARGSAPLLTTVIMMVAFGEHISIEALCGIALLIAGVWLMSVLGGRNLEKLERRAVAYALGTSVFIAAYTITDGMGARINGSAHGYAIWLFFIDATWMVLILLWVRGVRGFDTLAPFWRSGLSGGAMSFGAYWIATWAMTQAPIALVAALRESSVLFATVISALILKEPLSRWRVAAALTIVCGIAIAKIG